MMAKNLLWGLLLSIKCLSVLGDITKEVIVPGDGKTFPQDRWTVMIHYTEKFENGTVIDSSEGRKPIFFVVGEALPAWNEGVKSMSKGEICEIKATPELAYGEKRVPDSIPPNAKLVFQLRLVDTWSTTMHISLEDVVPYKHRKSTN